MSVRVDKMYDMLREQTEMIKEMNQLIRVKNSEPKEEKKDEFKLPKLQLFGF